MKGWLGFEESGVDVEDEVNLDEYLDGIGLHNGELLDEDKYTYIKSITANSPEIFQEVEREVKKGNIVLLDTENLSQTNRIALKKLIGDLKKLEESVNGDMGRISEAKILIVPTEFRILKRRV